MFKHTRSTLATVALAASALAACHHGQTSQSASGDVVPASSDSARNQTQSGVVDSTGSSTLGPSVKKTSPTQGAAVTSKGDTLRQGGDTLHSGGAAGTTRDTTMHRDTSAVR